MYWKKKKRKTKKREKKKGKTSKYYKRKKLNSAIVKAEMNTLRKHNYIYMFSRKNIRLSKLYIVI